MCKNTPKDALLLPLASTGFLDVQNLYEAVLQVFPDTSPKKLSTWEKKIFKETSIEPEPILFMAMVCGAYFRIYQPDVQEAIKGFKHYLTHGINKTMGEELADIIVEALSPRIRSVVKSRGYRLGSPDGLHLRKRGAPPKTRGVWVTAFVVAKYFHEKGMKLADAKQNAVKLASILLGRFIDISEFYLYHKKAPKTYIDKLVPIFEKEYDIWLHADFHRLHKDIPPSKDAKEYPEWLSSNKGLKRTMVEVGYESICSRVIDEIPKNLLESFWKIKTK